MTGSAAPKRRRPLPGLVTRAVREACARLVADAARHREEGTGEALHKLRVTLRRVSAASALFHGFPAKPDGLRAEELAHEARRVLSPAREHEVSAALVAKLSGDDTEPSRQALAVLGLEGDAPAPEVEATVGILVSELRAWSDALAAWTPAGDGLDGLERKIGKRLKKARRRVRELGVPGPRRLHRLRVAAKALRYELELVAGIAPTAPELLSALKKFQDALGEANDWAALHQTVRDRRASCAKDGRAVLDRLAPAVEEERRRALDRARRDARRFQAILDSADLALAVPRPRTRKRAAPSRR